jgi:thiol-disulfide isomerase/thioredoxin
MKNLFLYCILASNSVVLFAQNELEYTITGTLPDSIDNSYAYLTQTLSDSLSLKDSALITDGHFMFKGIANDKPILYNLVTEDARMNGQIVIEPGTITYNYPDDKLTEFACARGTPLNDQITDSLHALSFELLQMLKNPDTTKIHIESGQTYSLAKRYYANLISLMKENIENSLGEYFFLSYSQMIKEKERNEILPLLSKEAKQKYDDIKQKHDEKANTRKVVIEEGQTYINFTGKTPNSEQFILSGIITAKRLILLDFWASWCAPCMKSMPEIAELYDNYKNKGLEIIGISLDVNEMFWKKAIEKNNMSWIQIISNKGNSDNIAEMYGVDKIPHTILINSEGEIIGVNLRGEKLREKIKKVLE